MSDDGTPIRVLCVDDHRFVLEAVALIIGGQPDLEVVGSASSGEEAVDLFRLHHPDVTLMDLQLPGMSGVEAIGAIRSEAPDARIIVLTMYHGDEDIHRALQAGAATYLSKDILSDELIRFVHEVHAGRRPVTPDVQMRLAGRAAQGVLTSREIEVMELVSLGMRNKEIAASLGISTETVQVHVKNILSKFHVNDRAAAINVAFRRGFVHIR